MFRPAMIAGGLFAALGIYDVASTVGQWSVVEAQQVIPALSVKAGSIDRSRKSDRLPAAAAGEETNAIAIVEIVGLDAAAIVYRDNDGRVLYRTDPAANVTVVSKGVRLPQVTIQERRDEPTKPLPIEVPADGKERPRLVGCDPLASPLAGSAGDLTGRCLSMTETSRQVAALVAR